MSERDLSQDAALWDPSAPADADVAEIESRLAPLRFDPTARPLALPSRAPAVPARRRLWTIALPLAAALILAVGGAALWRWSWPERRPWPMTVRAGAAPPRADRLEVGRQFLAGPDTQALVDVARIGTMTVAPGSDLTLRTTSSKRHRLVLARGTIDLRVWAPAGWVGFQTPAGEVIDLGCVFRLTVTDDGTTRVRVDSGWVQLENFGGEVLIPAGTSSEMRVDGAPLVPVYDASTPRFRDGVRAVERATRADPTAMPNLDFLADAAPRDVLTLLVLARSLPPAARTPMLSRASELFAPPPGVSIEAIVAGDMDKLWLWYDALDLPSPKAWLLNWRDALR